MRGGFGNFIKPLTQRNYESEAATAGSLNDPSGLGQAVQLKSAMEIDAGVGLLPPLPPSCRKSKECHYPN
ncbi:hypothetical protein EJ110_NYTH18096 [Nymphaea thermarum]|nr:hypothetical protein EJ110_NYTH18096 [Nymphaea thermarum]